MRNHFNSRIIQISVILLILIAGISPLTSSAENLSDHIPEGYYLQNFMKVDLNQDGKTDYLLLTKSRSLEGIEENQFGQIVDRSRRGIIVLLKQDHGYHKVAENLTLFDSEFEDGGVYFAPDLWIYDDKDRITFHYGHGRYGYWFYTFRLQDNALKLIGFEAHSNRGPDPLSIISVNYLTKRLKYARNITESQFNEKWIEQWKTIPTLLLLDLNEISTIHDAKLMNITHGIDLNFES